MSTRTPPSPPRETERIRELLADRATVGLDDAGRAELTELGCTEDESFDLAAAAVELATLGALPVLPDELARRVLASATLPALPTPVVPLRRRSRAAVAWVAAAAGLAAGTVAVVWASQRAPEIRTEVRTVEVPPVTPPPAEARQRLLATARDATRLAWTPTAEPAAARVTGDVVWSPSAQQGYMRFVGLAPNDRATIQYQLWIFDKARDAKYPIDGGVFDVSESGEVIVRIDPKLHVNEATLFAVTIERPGGVVVSKREHIVVTAAASG